MIGLSLLLAIAAATPFGEPPSEKGVSLGLFASDPTYDYDHLLAEIRQTGATHISLVWVWWQNDVSSTTIRPKTGWSATKQQVERTVAQAKQRGFHVTAFPIVRLVQAEPGEWRGKINPKNEDAWWESYFEYIAHTAAIAEQSGAQRLVIGSELVSRERMRKRWLRLIERIRLRHPKLELMYSANWDHYKPVQFWDAVDHVGITGYWEVGRYNTGSLEQLRQAWAPILKELRTWSEKLGRSIIITEIGYPSLESGTKFPWDETRKEKLDLEIQELGYQAAAYSFSNQNFLGGLYWWNWFGFGGKEDRNYTPRNKPAAEIIKSWYLGLEHEHR
ncbi:MAG: hypothetical protein VYC39_05725 [Myxococcota bacterium]|nr:hypothetical protein [Myxococcota bacterium]